MEEIRHCLLLRYSDFLALVKSTILQANFNFFFLPHLQEHNTMVNLASALEKEGITAFRFDFAGNGYAEIYL